jgi:hypothetical protein
MVDVSQTAGREANYIHSSLEAMPLSSGISGRFPAATVDPLVAVVGRGLSVTLLDKFQNPHIRCGPTEIFLLFENLPECWMVSLFVEEKC